MVDYEEILERLENNKKLHEKMVKEGVENINKKLKSDKYTVDSLVADSDLGHKYHDLIDQKDMINSKLKMDVNKRLHQIDVELYHLNNSLDNQSRMINYKFESKKEELLSNLKYKVNS
ncbi:MAG: hypothetical protein IKF79_03385 [Methanosphaera sp.]|nr:hypothetical protein [Methanosphaera sp.]